MMIHAGDTAVPSSSAGLKNRAGIMTLAPLPQAFLMEVITGAPCGWGI